MNLPTPACEWGYTGQQIDEIFGVDGPQREAFDNWMSGQTRMLCEGRRYNHETKEHEEACGGVRHGGITYTWDVVRYAVPNHPDRNIWD